MRYIDVTRVQSLINVTYITLNY